MRRLIWMIRRNTAKVVGFTPAYQSYMSAGDEAEPYCPTCYVELDEDTNYCPLCGQKLSWDVGSPWVHDSRWKYIKHIIRRFFKKDDDFFDWGCD